MTQMQLRKAPDFDPDLPEYDVLSDGVLIGRVGRSWYRNGGQQWWTSLRGRLYPVAGTRRGAVNVLIKSGA